MNGDPDQEIEDFLEKSTDKAYIIASSKKMMTILPAIERSMFIPSIWWKLFEHNRDAYTNAKTEFIRKWTYEAKRVYAGRY